MSFLLWLAWMTAVVPLVVDLSASVGTASAPESGQDSQEIRMDILVAYVNRSAMRNQDIHFPEAVNADQPTVAALKERKRFVAFLRELQNKGLGRIRAETVVVTVSGHLASLASYPGNEAKPRAVPPLGIVPTVRPGGQVHVALDITALIAGKKPPVPGTVGIQVRKDQTLALTGMVLRQVTATRCKVPVLGDLPFVGRLFTSTAYAEEESELVVIVTPHLVGEN